jgi:hypothetical protein
MPLGVGDKCYGHDGHRHPVPRLPKPPHWVLLALQYVWDL